MVEYTKRLRKIVLKIKQLKKRKEVTADNLTRFNAQSNAEIAKKYLKGHKSEIKYKFGAENTVEGI